MTSAVDAALRFDGSVTTVGRHTAEPYAVGDLVIPPEQVLYFILGAANRDPAVYVEPERLVIGRLHNPRWRKLINSRGLEDLRLRNAPV